MPTPTGGATGRKSPCPGSCSSAGPPRRASGSGPLSKRGGPTSRPVSRCTPRPRFERLGALGVAYNMPADGQLTLGLFDDKAACSAGSCRTIFAPRATIERRGTDSTSGAARCRQGDYRLKAAYHPPLAAEYKMTLCNPGNPPWPTPDDRGDWLSDEANPQAVVSDGQWVFLAAPGCELGYSVIGLDEHRPAAMGHPRTLQPPLASRWPWKATISTCSTPGPESDRHQPFLRRQECHRPGVLMCLDKRTGRPGPLHPRDALFCAWPPGRIAKRYPGCGICATSKSFSPATYGGQPRYYCLDVGESTGALGLAAAGGKLYVSLFYENKLLVLDAASGKPTGEEIAIPAPVGLCQARRAHPAGRQRHGRCCGST